MITHVADTEVMATLSMTTCKQDMPRKFKHEHRLPKFDNNKAYRNSNLSIDFPNLMIIRRNEILVFHNIALYRSFPYVAIAYQDPCTFEPGLNYIHDFGM